MVPLGAAIQALETFAIPGLIEKQVLRDLPKHLMHWEEIQKNVDESEVLFGCLWVGIFSRRRILKVVAFRLSIPTSQRK